VTLAVAGFMSILPTALVFFLLHEVLRGVFGPIKDAYLHDNIPSEVRATVVSFESLAHHVGGAIGLMVTGFVAKQYGIPAAWLLSGIALAGGSLLVARNTRQR
jgi:sugar phosphate permease